MTFTFFQDYFEKGEYIIREGEEGNTFFIISKGEVWYFHTFVKHKLLGNKACDFIRSNFIRKKSYTKIELQQMLLLSTAATIDTCATDKAREGPQALQFLVAYYCKLAWNVPSLLGKEPELVWGVQWYQLDMVGLTSTHNMGSEIQLQKMEFY